MSPLLFSVVFGILLSIGFPIIAEGVEYEVVRKADGVIVKVD